MESYDKLGNRFQDLSKVKNPAARKVKSNNYLELSKKKKNILGNIMLSHWPGFTWKFFMIWLNQFFKQPPCPRNICAEHWRKLPNPIAFLGIDLYLKNNNSVKHLYKFLLIVLFIYLFQAMQICQIRHVNFESAGRFSFKFCVNLQCHQT